MQKIGFVSLGCAKNQVDLERLAGAFLGDSYLFSADVPECDVVIINTCGFIAAAVSEAVETILDIKSAMKADAKLIVFGCMTERYKADFANELPEADFVAGVGEDSLNSILSYLNESARVDITGSARYLLNSGYYAYLKISEGCNNRCAYCTIPSIRGNHVSIPIDKLILETKKLISGGAKEIIIISQDSTKYGSDLHDGATLTTLVEQLGSSYPDTYFRIMYLNPDGVTEGLIDAVAKLPNVLSYFDIPVQHGSDHILKLMNRHSTREMIVNVFKMIRAKLPNAVLRTTLIVGFPGESEADFEQSLTLLDEIKPDFAGFFPYSAEDGTKAAAMPDAVDNKIVKQRIKKLQSLQKKLTTDRLKKFKKGEIICFAEKQNDDFEFIIDGRALFQSPEIDGALYIVDAGDDGIDGSGPYRAKITKIAYPDIYVEIIGKV